MTENGLEKRPTRSVLACIKGIFTDTRYEKASKTVLGLKRKTEAGSTVTGKANEEIFENQVRCLLKEQQQKSDAVIEHLQRLDADDELTVSNVSFLMEQSYEELESIKNKLVNLYSNKIVEIQMQKPNIDTMNEEDDTVHLSKELKSKIVSELNVMEKNFCLGIQSGEHTLVDAKLFDQLVLTLEEQCPVLSEIFTTLIVGDKNASYFEHRSRKNLKFRLKGAIQSLSCLIQIGNQNSSSEMSLLFGIMAVSYGAGEQLTVNSLLNQIGISKSWDTL